MSLGSIFKIHRENYGVSIRKIASTTNIAASKLSAFENDKARLKDEEIVKIYGAIKMEYIKCSFDEDKVICLFLLLYKNISFIREDSCATIKELYKLKNEAQFSDMYITVLAGIFLYHTYQRDNDFEYENYIKVLLGNFSLLNYEVQQIVYDTLGVYYKNIYMLDKALKNIDKGIKDTTNNNTLGMLYYHKAMILKDVCRLSESLSCIKKAKKNFDKELNVKRAMYCSVVLACIYTRLGRYEEAEKINLQCIEAHKDCDYGDIMHIYNNLIWNFVLSKQYEKVLEYGSISSKVNMSHAGAINFYRSFAAWKLGNKREAQSFIVTAINHLDGMSTYMQTMINTFDILLSLTSSLKKKEQYLLITLQEAVKINDLQLQVFILKLLTELDYGEENLVKQIEYRNKIIDLLENNH